MGKERLIKWFKICNVKGLGPKKTLRLFEIYRDIEDVWNTSDEELLRTRVFNEKMIWEFKKLKDASSESFEKIINECEQNNISIVPMISSDFPEKLCFLSNPPLTLFLQGDRGLMYSKSVSIVGSRKSNDKAKKWTNEQASELARKDITIVSGGAKGIDYQAHRGSLDVSGKTICVMGPGLLNMYPKEHMDLFDEIKEKGLIISENLPSFPGGRIALLQRNRITSGISDAMITVTSANGGGSMTQLKHAYNQRVPIFSPKKELGFEPYEGIDAVKEEYEITTISNVSSVIERVDKNFNEKIPKQKALF